MKPTKEIITRESIGEELRALNRNSVRQELMLLVPGLLIWLPRVLWPLAEWPGVGAACAILAVLLAALMVVFTFAPPNNILFADLSGGAHTWLTIPV